MTALALVLAHDGRQLADWYQGEPPKEDFRSAMAFACAEAGDGDGVVMASVPDYFLPLADYYATDTCDTTGEAGGGTDRMLVVARIDPVPPPAGWTEVSVAHFTGDIRVYTFER